MNTLPQWLLVLSNFIIAAAVCIFVFGRSDEKQPKKLDIAAPAQAAEINLDPLLEPITSLDDSLTRFSGTLQRFNTTLVQYDFLQKEIQRMANLDQLIGNQLNLELQNKEQRGEDADPSVDETIGQIRELQGQVQQELEQRRQMMLQLIAGLEQELAKSSGDEAAVRDVAGDGPPVADPNIDIPSLPVPSGE